MYSIIHRHMSIICIIALPSLYLVEYERDHILTVYTCK